MSRCSRAAAAAGAIAVESSLKMSRPGGADVARAAWGALLTIALAMVGVTAQAADAEAGKTAARAKCMECHDADDWEGEDAASLESLIRDIVAGKVKHRRKLELSAAEIANIAAYWGAGGK